MFSKIVASWFQVWIILSNFGAFQGTTVNSYHFAVTPAEYAWILWCLAPRSTDYEHCQMFWLMLFNMFYWLYIFILLGRNATLHWNPQKVKRTQLSFQKRQWFLGKYMYLYHYLFYEMKHSSWKMTAPPVVESCFSLILMGRSSFSAVFICTAFQRISLYIHVYDFFKFLPLTDYLSFKFS